MRTVEKVLAILFTISFISAVVSLVLILTLPKPVDSLLAFVLTGLFIAGGLSVIFICFLALGMVQIVDKSGVKDNPERYRYWLLKFDYPARYRCWLVELD